MPILEKPLEKLNEYDKFKQVYLSIQRERVEVEDDDDDKIPFGCLQEYPKIILHKI
jgi:hypothetical protein